MNPQTDVFSAQAIDEAIGRIQHFIHSHDTLSRRNAHETVIEGESLLAVAQSLPTAGVYLPDLYLTLGIFHTRAAQHEQAVRYLYQAIPLLEQRGDTHLPTAWNYLGLVYSQVGDLEAALRALLKGVQVATEGGHVIRRASCLNDLAYLYIELGHPARAVEHLEECLLLLEPLSERGAQSLLPAVWDSLALCYVALGNYAKAEHYAHKAFVRAEQFGNPWGITNVWQTLGQVAFQQQHYQRAITAYSNAQSIARQHGFTYQEAQALLHHGKASLEHGDSHTAEHLLKQGLAIAEPIGAKPILHRIHETLATLAEREGRYAQAYHYYKLFHHLRDEHYGERLEQRAKILTLLHELDTAHHATQSAHRENKALQQEIAERTRLQAVLERLATIDDLTQLLNRRHFFTLVDHYLQTAVSPCVGLLVMDVDHFKHINDRFGHEAGDVVLQEVAQRLNRLVTTHESVGRYGGEEFIIFLPDTDPEAAHKIASDVLTAVRNRPFIINNESITVTASIGLVTLPLPIERTLLFRYADQALYQAKANGRNQVVVYAPH
jgi:diguanylate cyclase (GGDEF)-like protein